MSRKIITIDNKYNICKLKLTMTPIVIGVLRTIPKGFTNWLDELEIE